ncbi:MAG: acyltransferase family protein [Prevotella sp.]|nr:acyltransferase family protein [Prevotella sp.]
MTVVKMKKHRINYIDRMKGMAIFIVVLAHVFLFSFDMEDSLCFRFCASFEMPLFMFVSGFVAYIHSDVYGKEEINRKLSLRIISYLCPAFAITWSLALYKYVVLAIHDLDIVGTLIEGLWYLKALAIFICIQFILVRCRKLTQELAVIILAECLFLIGWKMCPFIYKLFCLEHCFFFFPFFIMGYYFRMYKLEKVLTSRNWLFSISIIGFVCLLNVNFEYHALRFISERFVRPIFAILAITYIFANREGRDSKLDQWFSHIGKKTLDIYIYHGIFIVGTFSIFDLKFICDNEVIMSNPLSLLILATLITFFLMYISIAIGALVRKSNLLRKIVYGK